MVFYRYTSSWKQVYKSFNLKSPGFLSNLGRKRLLKLYRHNVFIRLTTGNSMLTTKIPGTRSNYNISIGQVQDFKRGKKKKRTYMAGFELGLIVSRHLATYNVKSLCVFWKGQTAARDGIYQAFSQLNMRLIKIYNRTPIAHNGTRGKGQRRL